MRPLLGGSESGQKWSDQAPCRTFGVMSLNRSLVAQLADKVVQHALTGARPSSPTDGVDLSSWKTGGAYGPVSIEIYFDGTTAATIGVPAGGTLGVELWGWKLGQWWVLAPLNAGAVIPIASDTLGAAVEVDGVGGFDRLFVAGTMSAGAGTAQFVPFEVMR
jgi:hypothetical protein